MVEASKWLEPVVFAKRCLNDKSQPYQIALFSFQSTGAINIMTVNSVLNGKAYIRKKVRGKEGNYYHRVLEDNPARTMYLATYGAVDKIEPAIKRVIMFYCCRKYYYSVNIHTKAATLVSAYSFYNECCDGNIDNDWFVPVNKRMTRMFFQQRLGEQMMEYDPRLGLFPGDKRTRPYIQLGSRRRSTTVFKQRKKIRLGKRITTPGTLAGSISRTSFETTVNSGRLVQSFPQIQQHILAKTTQFTKSNKRKAAVGCFVCGEKTPNYCSLCTIGPKDTSVPLCYFDCVKAVVVNGKSIKKKRPGLCYFNYHSLEYFDLCRGDASDAGILKKDWKKATKHTEIMWA